MRRGVLGLAAAFVVGALLAGSAALWLARDGRGEPPEPAPTPASSPGEISHEGPAPAPEGARTRIEGEQPVAPGEAEEEPVEAQPAPTEVHYSIAEKYKGERLSDVPHRLLGAWDDAPDQGTPGRHRSFVLVVDPGTTDRQLEQLARDIRRLNQDADRLDVRIYDRAEAATGTGSSAGAGRYADQVAEVKRHRGLGVDVIRVRGRIVEP